MTRSTDVRASLIFSTVFRTCTVPVLLGKCHEETTVSRTNSTHPRQRYHGMRYHTVIRDDHDGCRYVGHLILAIVGVEG